MQVECFETFAKSVRERFYNAKTQAEHESMLVALFETHMKMIFDNVLSKDELLKVGDLGRELALYVKRNYHNGKIN